MAKTVAGKISGVLSRNSFFLLWMCIAWNWGDPVKNFLLISKDISFIIKMVWSLFWLFQKKSPKPWPEKTLVWLTVANTLVSSAKSLTCFLRRLGDHLCIWWIVWGLTHFPVGYRWWLQSMTSFGRLIPPFVFFHVKSPLSRVVDFHLYHNPWTYELNACVAQCQMPFENQGILPMEFFLSRSSVHCSITSISCVAHERPFLQQCWCFVKKPFSSISYNIFHYFT